MKRLLTLVAFFATLQASSQQVNPVPDYVFRNQMSVGRNAVTDTAAYFSIGPRYGATKGFMPPIVGDTATFSSGKRNGLLIFSVQKNKFLYWDSVRVQWSDMAGSSGSYITGSGITGYLPQFSASTTLDTSALFTLGNRLGIGTSTFAYNSTNTANMELNGTAGGILGFKRNDSARGYLWHTGDNMELANTTAGSISFNTNSATRGSISSAGVWRLHNLAGTGDRVVQASSNGTLSASTSVTGLVDTLTISTRAWRQKGDDSLGAIIATKGSGTVTSVATGYGLSGGTITTTGTLLVDTLNIATRAWRQKGLDSLAALEVSGSGTTNYVPKFTASSTIGNSQIFDNGTNVGIGTASPLALLHINGSSATAVQSFIRNANGGTNSASELVFGTWSGAIPTGSGNPGPSAKISAVNVNSNNASTDLTFTTYNGGGTPGSAERLRITYDGNVGIGGTPLDKFTIFQDQNATSTARIRNTDVGSSAYAQFVVNASGNSWGFRMGSSAANSNALDIVSDAVGTPASRLRIFANGRIGINTTTDAGYQLDVNGTLRSVNGANFATTSGQVGIGKTSPSAKSKLDVEGNIDIADGSFYYLRNAVANTGTYGMYYSNSAPKYPIRLAVNADPTNNRFFEIGWHKNDNKDSTWNPTFSVNSYNAETFINTTSDAGDYKLQVSGNIYNTGSAVLAATSGNVGIGTASPSSKLDVVENAVAINQLRVGQDAVHKVMIGAETNFAEIQAIRVGVDFNKPLVLQRQGGNVGVGTSLPTTYAGYTTLAVNNATNGGVIDIMRNNSVVLQIFGDAGASGIGSLANVPFTFKTNSIEQGRINTAGEFLLNSTNTDAGDYKLQVSGNALVTAGKLDITTNTGFGLSVSRSGTSVVAGQINNSNGILYYGAESSTGGGLFTGSSAYAAVIGSGANYPLQFATNNATRATINTNGELLINTTTDNGDFKLQVNGNALISGSIKTANGTSSTAVPWHLGSVVATNVQLDTANYVEVEINGVYYRLAIVTPL